MQVWVDTVRKLHVNVSTVFESSNFGMRIVISLRVVVW